MENLTFYNFEKSQRGRAILGRKLRLYNKSGNRTASFSTDCRSELLAIKEPKLQIAENNLTGELFCVISSETGIRIKENTPGGKSAPVVYSKQLVDLLYAKLGLEGEKADVQLSKNVSRKPGLITYKIIPPQR